MFRAIISVVMLLLTASAAYAGSCADCKTTYQEHYAACRGDTTCQQRAKEAYDRCQVGCSAAKTDDKTKLIPTETEHFLETSPEQANCGSSCSIPAQYCSGCSISCPVGKAAVCTPGKVWCPSTGCQCQQQPTCLCQ